MHCRASSAVGSCTQDSQIHPGRMVRCLLSGVVCLGMLLSACGCGDKSSSYDRLCKIYEEYSSASTPRDVAAVKITERVERELPEIYQDYVVVVMNPVEGRYDSFRELARKTANQPSWSCEAVRTFYIAAPKAP